MLIYGNHPKSMQLWESARKVLDLFTQKEVWERDALAKELGIDFSESVKKKDEKKWANNKKKFYKIISPLLDKLLVSSQDRRAGKTYYRVSYDTVKAWLNNIIRSLYYKYGKYAKEG